MNNYVQNREKGMFPVSIGTSLCLEYLINKHPEIVHKPANRKPVTNYKHFFINLRTVFRNLYQAVSNDHRDSIMPTDYFEPFIQELEFLLDWAKNEGEGIRVFFYAVEFRGMKALYPDAKLRNPNTQKQLRYKQVEEAVISVLFENSNYRERFDPISYRSTLNQAPFENTIILTHYAVDLLSKYKFRKLDLIESHTGKIKTDKEFNSKYLNGNQLYMMPFNIGLMQVFGDKETFAPLNISIKKEVLRLADQYNWTPITSKDKIKSNINSIQNPEIKSILKAIFVSG